MQLTECQAKAHNKAYSNSRNAAASGGVYRGLAAPVLMRQAKERTLKMKIAVINNLTPEHPAWKHGKRLDVKIFTQLYPDGPQYYCGNGKWCENMEAVKAFIAEEAPDKISDEREE